MFVVFIIFCFKLSFLKLSGFGDGLGVSCFSVFESFNNFFGYGVMFKFVVVLVCCMLFCWILVCSFLIMFISNKWFFVGNFVNVFLLVFVNGLSSEKL